MPQALLMFPPLVQSHLRQLGEDLTIARKRRGESRRQWAERIGVSEPTLMRIEKGDPSVALGIYASALWLIGRSSELAKIAAPEFDLGALELSINIAKKRSVRKPISLENRLQKKAQPCPSLCHINRQTK
ncbi:helix-turn-helix domain-containing protein [Zwartia vadi]|uniref:helix-turn-helix domain-containing protein n=1 Tax=Zwartia vadi TaxID=3058168 RepID=UPI0025B2F1BD|nr:helix-turn-helix transcriptional regulator [Zwartia vadi]MDN3987958.1 helix-turn-helix transcriptional regulator [Zwartia vadi]